PTARTATSTSPGSGHRPKRTGAPRSSGRRPSSPRSAFGRRTAGRSARADRGDEIVDARVVGAVGVHVLVAHLVARTDHERRADLLHAHARLVHVMPSPRGLPRCL